jgi:hypothetical protein
VPLHLDAGRQRAPPYGHLGDLAVLCPFIAAAVELHDPAHPARVRAREYKKAFAARITETAPEAGASNPEQLGEQLSLLLDGASARNRVLDTDTFATAAIAVVLIDNAIPRAAVPRAESGGEAQPTLKPRETSKSPTP